MAKLKKGDFIEVEYTGMLDNNEIFDTTDEEKAKSAGIHTPRMEFGPIIVCLGEGHLIKGIDTQLEGKEPGEYHFDIKAEDAFGKKNPKLIHLMQTNAFKKQGVRPAPGLQVNIDGMVGTIRTVTGGRTIVDFNHVLAGKDLKYDIKVNRIVTDKKEQLQALLKLLIGAGEAKIELKGTDATIALPQEVPKKLAEELSKKLYTLTDINTTFKTTQTKPAETSEQQAPAEHVHDENCKH